MGREVTLKGSSVNGPGSRACPNLFIRVDRVIGSNEQRQARFRKQETNRADHHQVKASLARLRLPVESIGAHFSLLTSRRGLKWTRHFPFHRLKPVAQDL